MADIGIRANRDSKFKLDAAFVPRVTPYLLLQLHDASNVDHLPNKIIAQVPRDKSTKLLNRPSLRISDGIPMQSWTAVGVNPKTMAAVLQWQEHDYRTYHNLRLTAGPGSRHRTMSESKATRRQ
jgi:hypothetical protein